MQTTNEKINKDLASISDLSCESKCDNDHDDDQSLYDVGPAGEIYEGPKIPLKV